MLWPLLALAYPSTLRPVEELAPAHDNFAAYAHLAAYMRRHARPPSIEDQD